MSMALQQAGMERRWCQAVTTSQTDTTQSVHLPCGCHIAVREVAPGAYAATILPRKDGRHQGSRFSERRIEANSIYGATADAIAKGRSGCVVRARQALARYAESAKNA